MLTETVDYNQVKITYQYDEQDRILKEQTGSEYTDYEYDTYGRLAGVKTKGSKIAFTYNKYGELEQKTYENGETVRYLYDKYGRTGEATVYTYDANGNRETATFANGVKLTYTYDDLGRLILQKSIDANGEVISQYAYTLGKNGERTKVTESGACGDVETAYEYDKANCLVKETIRTDAGKTVYEYRYDKAGNRISKEKDGVKTLYTYDGRNRLITEKNGNSEIVYHYDANGNLVKQSGGADTIYTYDVYNRLTAYRQGEKEESYTYDAEGVRRSKTTGADSIYFVSDTSGSLAQTLAETDGKGNIKAEYTRTDGLVAQIRDGKVSYYLYDGHGDVRALLSEAGKITDKYRYNAYGELIEKTGDTENHYLYTGEYYDGTSNLYYLRARYMNPSTGNFLTMDTYEGSIYDPDTLHKYLYANGNPVMYTGPSGNMSMSLGDVAIGVLCMGLLYTSVLHFDYVRKISNAGIIPSSSYPLIGKLQKEILPKGVCTFAVIVTAIKGKIKGKIEIYEESALDAVDEMDKNKEMFYVYFLKNSDGQIEYVGRTGHLKSRITAHANSSNRKELKLAGFVRIEKLCCM